MGNFYNPFMKGPDFGSGIAGTGQDIMQMLMMKKLMGGESTPSQTTLGQTPLPQQSPMQKIAELQNTDKMLGGASDAASNWKDQDLGPKDYADILRRFMMMMRGGPGMGGMAGGV